MSEKIDFSKYLQASSSPGSSLHQSDKNEASISSVASLGKENEQPKQGLGLSKVEDDRLARTSPLYLRLELA